MPVIDLKQLLDDDTHKGDIIGHTVIWKFGPVALGFIWVNLEGDGEKKNKRYLVLTEVLFHRLKCCFTPQRPYSFTNKPEITLELVQTRKSESEVKGNFTN